VQTEPAQILEDLKLGTRHQTRGIEIIDAQEPGTTAQSRLKPTDQGRAQIAPVQGTTGRRGKTAPVTTRAQRQAPLKPDAHVARQQIRKKGGPWAALHVLASDQP
jgi:hypothetical protein